MIGNRLDNFFSGNFFVAYRTFNNFGVRTFRDAGCRFLVFTNRVCGSMVEFRNLNGCSRKFFAAHFALDDFVIRTFRSAGCRFFVLTNCRTRGVSRFSDYNVCYNVKVTVYVLSAPGTYPIFNVSVFRAGCRLCRNMCTRNVISRNGYRYVAVFFRSVSNVAADARIYSVNLNPNRRIG